AEPAEIVPVVREDRCFRPEPNEKRDEQCHSCKYGEITPPGAVASHLGVVGNPLSYDRSSLLGRDHRMASARDGMLMNASDHLPIGSIVFGDLLTQQILPYIGAALDDKRCSKSAKHGCAKAQCDLHTRQPLHRLWGLFRKR